MGKNYHEEWKKRLDGMDKETLQSEVESDTYQGCVAIFEALEHLGKVSGNGHHMAQAVAEFAGDLFKKRAV
jgi:hypothetical protein